MKDLGRVSYAFLILTLFFVAGCKKKKAKVEKRSELALRQTGVLDEYVFDDGGTVKDFSFVEEDNRNQKASKNTFNTESDITDALLREELEDEILALSEYQDDFEDGFERINFEFNKKSLLKGQQARLHKNIKTARIATKNDKNVEVRAYCCEMGPQDFNMALSQKRANAIREEMVAHGIPSGKVSAVGRGQEYQIAWSNSDDRKTRIRELSPNRRVEISATPSS